MSYRGMASSDDYEDDLDADIQQKPVAKASSRRARTISSSLRDPNDPSAWPDEITLDYFYKPHTITILILSVAGLVFTAFYRFGGEEYLRAS